MKIAFAALAMLGAVAVSPAADARQVEFTYTGTIADAGTPGIAPGDTLTLHLFADNGGDSLVNQVWNYADLQNFDLSAGSYAAKYSTVFAAPLTDNFTTDANGAVSTASFYGTNPTSVNSDNFGTFVGDTVFGDGSFVDSLGNNNTQTTNFTNPAQWTVAFVSSGGVPEPATWAMMLLGFGMVGAGLRYRRKGTAVRFA